MIVKILAKPASNFMLLLDRNEVLHSHRPSVITHNDYIQSKVVTGDLKVANVELPDDATDLEFQKFWEDSGKNEEMAVSNYLSKYRSREELLPQNTPSVMEVEAKRMVEEKMEAQEAKALEEAPVKAEKEPPAPAKKK